MKKRITFFGVLVVVLSACSPRMTADVETDHQSTADSLVVVTDDTMNEVIGKDSLAVYFGTIMHTRSYCGGARPPQALLDELATPQPYPNHGLIFKNTVSNKEYSFMTDEHGHYEIELPAGTYKLHPGKRFNTEEENYTYDPNCNAWLSMVFTTLEVTSPYKVHSKDFTVHIPCDPCDPNIRLRP